jgi:serine/threonine protein kinase
VYALGATLYALLTGLEPVESIQRVIKDTLVPPEQINPAIAKEHASAIRKAMQMDPRDRYQDAESFQAALESSPKITSTLPLPQEFSKPTARIASAAGPRSISRQELREWFSKKGIYLLLGLAVLAIVAVLGAQALRPAGPGMDITGTYQEEVDPSTPASTEAPTLRPSQTGIPPSATSAAAEPQNPTSTEEPTIPDPSTSIPTPVPTETRVPSLTPTLTRTKSPATICVYQVQAGDNAISIGNRFWGAEWPELLYPPYACEIEYRDSQMVCISKSALTYQASESGWGSHIFILGQWVWIPSLSDNQCVPRGGVLVLDLSP